MDLCSHGSACDRASSDRNSENHSTVFMFPAIVHSFNSGIYIIVSQIVDEAGVTIHNSSEIPKNREQVKRIIKRYAFADGQSTALAV